MPERIKIGVVYGDERPQVLSDTSPEGVPWALEYFQQNRILCGPVSPLCDFFAVLFCPDAENPEMHRQLATVFPSAQIVSYSTAASRPVTDFPYRPDGIMNVQLPVTVAMARQMRDSFALLKSIRGELAGTREQKEELREFFDAFVNAVAATCSEKERGEGIRALMDTILAHIRAEGCIIYSLDENGSTLHRAFCSGNLKHLDAFDYGANSSILNAVVRSGVPYVNSEYASELKDPFSRDTTVFVRSLMCVALERGGDRIGAVELINKIDGGFSIRDQTLLQMLVPPLFVALRTVQTFDRAQRLTITDDLTKLHNYRYLMQFLKSEVKRCLRYKKKVSLLFIDIDGFKRINDTFGHLVGSQALAEIGQVFRGSLRETDVVARYGGDEFVIVLPETPLNGAMTIAERIRKKVEDYEFVAQNLSIRLTVSLGVANCPRHTLTAEGLIKKADAAMYRAKEFSKNSIKVAV